MSRVKDICELNRIAVEDLIYAGQENILQNRKYGTLERNQTAAEAAKISRKIKHKGNENGRKNREEQENGAKVGI